MTEIAMTPKLSKNNIGSEEYYEFLRDEADFWGRVSTGNIDCSVAVWRDAKLAQVISGDLQYRRPRSLRRRG